MVKMLSSREDEVDVRESLGRSGLGGRSKSKEIRERQLIGRIQG